MTTSTIQGVPVSPTPPAEGETLVLTGGVYTPAAGGGGASASYALVADVKSNVDGGGAVSGSWLTRDLNTEVFDPDAIVSVAANQFVLVPGTYVVSVKTPFVGVYVTTRLQDITNAATRGFGQTSNDNGSAEMTWAFIDAMFTIAAPTTYEIQYYSSGNWGGNGLGDKAPAAAAIDSIYTQVFITKVA